MTILVINADKVYSEYLQLVLQKNGYRTAAASSGAAAIHQLESKTIGMVVLDIGLTDMQTEELCSKIRARSKLPILVHTNQAGEEQRWEAVKWQIDVYLTKQEPIEHLLQAIAYLNYRTDSSRGKKVLRDIENHFYIDLEKRLIKKDGKEIHLTPTEYRIFEIMLQSPGRVFTREQLIAYALDEDFHGYDRSIDTYIKGLRKKIETNTSKPQYIKTVHGVGYKLVIEFQ